MFDLCENWRKWWPHTNACICVKKCVLSKLHACAKFDLKVFSFWRENGGKKNTLAMQCPCVCALLRAVATFFLFTVLSINFVFSFENYFFFSLHNSRGCVCGMRLSFRNKIKKSFQLNAPSNAAPHSISHSKGWPWSNQSNLILWRWNELIKAKTAHKLCIWYMWTVVVQFVRLCIWCMCMFCAIRAYL